MCRFDSYHIICHDRIYVLFREGNMQDFDRLWDYNNPAATQEKFKAILDKTDVSGNEVFVAQLYTQLARTQSLQRKWNEAYAYLDKAKDLLPVADKVSEVRYLLEIGRTYNSSGKREKAYVTFLKAWELGKEIGADGYATDAGHMLAIASDTPEKTLDWNLKTVVYAKQSDDPAAQKWLGSLYNNIGWTYFDSGDHEKALETFRKALDEREKQDNPENIRIAKWCIARVLRELGQVEDALDIQRDLLAEHQKNNTSDQYVTEELALCFAKLGDATNASTYAKQAVELMSQDSWMVENEPERLGALKALI